MLECLSEVTILMLVLSVLFTPTVVTIIEAVRRWWSSVAQLLPNASK